MRTLYLECNMGAAGDMLFAALLELHPDAQGFIRKMNGLGIPGVKIKAEPAMKCGITGTHVEVTVSGEEEVSRDMPLSREGGAVHTHSHFHDPAKESDREPGDDGDEHHHHHHHHHGSDDSDGIDSEHYPHSHHHHHPHSHQTHVHRGLAEIRQMIEKLEIPPEVKTDAIGVYERIAGAESSVHNRTVDEIHFHEVGTMDAVADIVGVCLLIHELAPEKIVASAVNTGFGQVRCAHGILPVPAPATAYLLKNVPVYSGRIEGELCTPTGAALLSYFVSDFQGMPTMRMEKTGYGMGKKDFEAANCVRAVLGEMQPAMNAVTELACNLDDMTPEEIGFATERLLEKGALDVYTTSIYMKKNRPGVLFTCMCTEAQKEEMLRLMFQYTTTLGIREYVCNRYCMSRSIEKKQTPYGEISVKNATGYGSERRKAEYEDLARIAKDREMSLWQVRKEINQYDRTI